ncbi:hypothetical protein CF336_g2858 [Tilletia laevis]|uniref:Uncharacterized protein n=2 Tax=Tilletia TaxID=13289 RepID=A0A177VFF9_9BASI|nr:hypothetical protein CF336_g2858 [Tilletia laevis]KAE8206231.1 hypothetical protein CF335_g2026 [Tilletia laevis]KAE8262363.1 hypothetical protein A4X03_0g2512 [Tilletia caries]
MFYPRLLFLLPHLVLLLATAVRSAPVPDTTGCTSCPGLSRTLQARGCFSSKPMIEENPAWTGLKYAEEEIERRLQEAREALKRAQDQPAESQHHEPHGEQDEGVIQEIMEMPGIHQSQINLWELQIESLEAELKAIRSKINAFPS